MREVEGRNHVTPRQNNKALLEMDSGCVTVFPEMIGWGLRAGYNVG